MKRPFIVRSILNALRPYFPNDAAPNLKSHTLNALYNNIFFQYSIQFDSAYRDKGHQFCVNMDALPVKILINHPIYKRYDFLSGGKMLATLNASRLCQGENERDCWWTVEGEKELESVINKITEIAATTGVQYFNNLSNIDDFLEFYRKFKKGFPLDFVKLLEDG